MNTDHEVECPPSVGDVQELIGRIARINTGKGDKSDDLERGKEILDRVADERKSARDRRRTIQRQIAEVDAAIAAELAGAGAGRETLAAVGY